MPARRTALTFLLLAPLNFAAADTARPAPAAFQTVKNASKFTIGGVGFLGVTSAEEQAFRSLLAAPEARSLFRKLASQASKAGQLYAVLGLKLLDDPAYAKESARLLGDDTPVTTMYGCIVSQMKVSDLARLIADGKLK
jgi:hypothetical protein